MLSECYEGEGEGGDAKGKGGSGGPASKVKTALGDGATCQAVSDNLVTIRLKAAEAETRGQGNSLNFRYHRYIPRWWRQY